MPNVTVPAAALGLPAVSLLYPDLRFDRTAILRAAHAEARATIAKALSRGWKPQRYSVALKHALAATWSDATAHLFCAKRDAEMAAMDAETRGLIQARTIALHIDSTVTMIRTVAAIDAQLADLRVAA